MENFREHKARGILSYISFFGSPILQNRERVDKHAISVQITESFGL